MHLEKTEGIVLRSQDYQERHRIATLFTPEGILSLIIKNISRRNTRLLTLTTPFTHAEYHYRPADLAQFHDGTILSDHHSLRHSLTHLRTAGALASAILASQLPGKPAPALYALYRSYHSQVPHIPPSPLLASFHLKLLKHEGLLTLTPTCPCGAPATHLSEGESFCPLHALHPIPFTPEQFALLLALDSATQFSTLRTLVLPPDILPKITTLIKQWTG